MSQLPPTRVVIADDHALVRAGLRMLVQSMPGLQVVGDADNGQALLDQLADMAPDLVLLDLSMPGLGGMEALARMQTLAPAVRVIVLSMHQEEPYVRQALRHGAAGYLVKDSAPAELELAIRAVARGETYLSPAVSRVVVQDYAERLRADERAASPLTARQTEVLKLIARGFSSKDIARQLDVSLKTVDTHRSQLMRELGVHEVTGLVRYALRQGLIAADD